MDTPFIYETYVTGKAFIGRKAECNVLCNMLGSGENIVLFGPPKSGKMSFIQQGLLNMRISGKQYSVSQLNLFNVRDLKSFLLKFGNCVVRSCASTPSEYGEISDSFLQDSRFRFDRERFSETGEVISIEGEPVQQDIAAILRLPARIASIKNENLFCIIEEFQNLTDIEEYESVFSVFKEVMAEMKEKKDPGCRFIFSGSRTNAMKYIFCDYKYFHRLVEYLPLGEVDEREIIEYAVKGFLTTGKVIERDLVLGACRLFRNNLWYINHFLSICDSLTKGYINEGILLESLRIILSIHEPRFLRIMSNLTGHQISFIKAVMEGVTKFSATEIIEKYSLNSSANVRRVKDALCKKEIITFNEKDEAIILDPLFEYWLGKYYFELRGF